MHDRSLAKKITPVVCISIIWLIVYVNGGGEVGFEKEAGFHVEFFREENSKRSCFDMIFLFPSR